MHTLSIYSSIFTDKDFFELENVAVPYRCIIARDKEAIDIWLKGPTDELADHQTDALDWVGRHTYIL